MPDTAGVYLVPAFVGLGAPLLGRRRARRHRRPDPRHDTAATSSRAALEAIAYQVARRRSTTMRARLGRRRSRELRVDGGAAANDLLMQFQADVLGVPVVRPQDRRDDRARAPPISPASAPASGSRRRPSQRLAVDERTLHAEP
ncbi:MAG: FGGY-family carbohydrate kinase [Anaerotruncus sp.]|nr:FGGY-family carbohydrate kinase [Anaerotruncus sp.]